MALLGVVTKKENETLSLFESGKRSVIKITQKEQLKTVSGVVIVIKKKEELSTAIEWLLACRENPTLFVWIFSLVNLNEELSILMSLGANGVYSDKSNLDFFNLVIGNTLTKIEQFSKLNKQHENESVINFKNQTVLVNGVEKELTRKEFKLFQILYENKDICVTYDELQKQIWPNKDGNELYLLTNAIFHLREKIKKSDFYQIKTIRSKGYLLTIKKKEHEE